MRPADSPRFRRPRIAALAIPAALIISIVTAPAAFADDATTITFASPAQTVPYGSDWYETIRVSTQYRTLDSPDGTVDVYADGATTPFVGGIALYRGGTAYLTPDASRAPLASGVHTLTAIYRPSGGSGLISSQTMTPLTVTVTPLALTASAKVDPAASNPAIDLALSGPYVDALSTPAGEWTVDVTDSRARSLFSGHVVQPAGATTPLVVDLGTRLAAGDNVTITATFASPDAAAGATLTQPSPVKLQIPALTPGQVISSPLPWWTLALVGLLTLLAAALLIIQLWRARRPTAAVGGENGELATAVVAHE